MRAMLVASTTLFLACSSATPSVPASVDTQEASYAIGPSGSIVMTADGSSVSVPAGALTHDVTVSIESDPGAPALTDATPVGLYYLMGPEGQQFDKPVTVTLAFDPTELPPGQSASDIVVYTAPRASADYQPLDTTVVDSLHVSVETTHFSHFVPALPKGGPYAKVFGLGGDAASNAVGSPLFGQLKAEWKTDSGFSLKSARLVFEIDAVDTNADDSNLKALASANQLDVNSWVSANQVGLTGPAGLEAWVNGVAGAGLTPVVAIYVKRFLTCQEDNTTKNKSCPKGAKQVATSLGYGQFRARFGYLLNTFPAVKSWGLINEPDINGFTGDAGVADAVGYYIQAAEVLGDLHKSGKARGVSLFAGEFATYSQSYWNAFGDEMIKQVEASHTPFPRFWGLHPYADTTNGNTDGASGYVTFIEGLEKKANQKDGTLRVWLTETGTMLEWPANPVTGVLDCHADSGEPKKQYDGAGIVYAFAAKKRIDRIYWWQFEQAACTWGGDWDSGMVDWNGDPRPAYCALTKQPIATCHGLDVSRDCGGPGKGNCGGTASSSTAVCCAKCSNEDDAYYAAQVGSATCAQAAASFCGDVDYSRGSVESMYLGSCVVAPY